MTTEIAVLYASAYVIAASIVTLFFVLGRKGA